MNNIAYFVMQRASMLREISEVHSLSNSSAICRTIAAYVTFMFKIFENTNRSKLRNLPYFRLDRFLCYFGGLSSHEMEVVGPVTRLLS